MVPRLKDLGLMDGVAAVALAISACAPFLPISKAVQWATAVGFMLAIFTLANTLLALKRPACCRDYHAYDPTPARFIGGFAAVLLFTLWSMQMRPPTAQEAPVAYEQPLPK